MRYKIDGTLEGIRNYRVILKLIERGECSVEEIMDTFENNGIGGRHKVGLAAVWSGKLSTKEMLRILHVDGRRMTAMAIMDSHTIFSFEEIFEFLSLMSHDDDFVIDFIRRDKWKWMIDGE